MSTKNYVENSILLYVYRTVKLNISSGRTEENRNLRKLFNVYFWKVTKLSWRVYIAYACYRSLVRSRRVKWSLRGYISMGERCRINGRITLSRNFRIAVTTNFAISLACPNVPYVYFADRLVCGYRCVFALAGVLFALAVRLPFRGPHTPRRQRLSIRLLFVSLVTQTSGVRRQVGGGADFVWRTRSRTVVTRRYRRWTDVRGPKLR